MLLFLLHIPHLLCIVLPHISLQSTQRVQETLETLTKTLFIAGHVELQSQFSVGFQGDSGVCTG